MKKQYYCKWCNNYTNKKRHHLYCDQNPDGPENYKRLCKKNKEIYEKYVKDKLTKASHKPDVSARRKETVRKNWEKGVYKDVDFGSRFKGKTHSLTLRLKQSIGMNRYWKRKEPELLEKSLDKHNIILPGFSGYESAENKTVIGGEFFEEDFVNYEDEYDPFK